ncbi:MAG: dihydroorotase family protein [Planctomycetes bacterium]|nr:dihydroorotase family protein [Planctomycetota bacterium]MCP4771665.1 dihydroorotase family protein [Planctomycetota bacterium]
MSPNSATPTLFRNGRLFDGDTFLEATDLLTDSSGQVAAIGTGLEAPDGTKVVEMEGRWLLPGLVDCHVHFRDPGLVHKEGYAFGSSGALHGGVTTICEIQNNPPLMSSPQTLADKLENLRGVSRVDYAPYGSLVEDSLGCLAEIGEMCPAVKVFLGGSTGSGGIGSEENMRRWFTAAAAAGLKVVAHCEDDAIMDAAAAKIADDPELNTRHDLHRTREAEVQSIKDAIRVAIEVGLSLHVFHVSTYEGAELIAAAAAEGHPITCSTGTQYLLITAEIAHKAKQNRFKVNPAIKYEDDRAGLGKMVMEGRLPVVGTDHAPHPLEHKDRPYKKAPSGFPSIDLLLPMIFAAADLNDSNPAPFLHAVTAGPAREFGIAGKGKLEVGADADLIVVDPTIERIVDEAELLSRSGWSPFHGFEFRGFPQQVYLRGEQVFADGAVVGPPRGEPLFANKS